LIGPEYSAFAVAGRPDLGMVIYNPAMPVAAERIPPQTATSAINMRRAKRQASLPQRQDLLVCCG
jgi:hypothetical protein